MNRLKVAKSPTEKIALAYEAINLALKRNDASKIAHLFYKRVGDTPDSIIHHTENDLPHLLYGPIDQ